jgi:heme-degrading monooxygenase HmoA
LRHETYAVIFTSKRTSADEPGYTTMAERMKQLARLQPGFQGLDSARGPEGRGITISYWDSLEAIHAWRNQAEHLVAQELGRQRWYDSYRLIVARVERTDRFERQHGQ